MGCAVFIAAQDRQEVSVRLLLTGMDEGLYGLGLAVYILFNGLLQNARFTQCTYLLSA